MPVASGQLRHCESHVKQSSCKFYDVQRTLLTTWVLYGNERTGQTLPGVPAEYKGNKRCSEVVSMKGVYSVLPQVAL